MTERWRASSRAIHTRTPRGGVVLDPVSKAYFVLNETGEALWASLERGADVDELVATLCASFEVDEAQARVDVAAWLDELRAVALVERDAIG